MSCLKETEKPQRHEITEYPNLIRLIPLSMHRRLLDRSYTPFSTDSDDSYDWSDQSSATTYCPICRKSVHHFANHIVSHWEPISTVSFDQPATEECRSVHNNVMVTLYKERELRLRNWSNQPLIVQAVFLISPFDASCLAAGDVLKELLPKQDCVFAWRPELASKYGSSTICVLTEMPDGTEFVEWHELQPCCPLVRGPNDHLRKYPVETVPISHEILAICGESHAKQNAFANRMRASFGPDGLTADNYLRFWTLVDQLERAGAQFPLDAYRMFMRCQKSQSSRIFTLQIPAHQMPNGAQCTLTQHDMAVFRDGNGDVLENDTAEVYANIVSVTPKGLVTVRLAAPNTRLQLGRQYEVAFHAHSYPQDMQLGALKWMNKCGVVPLLFGQPAKLSTPLPAIGDAADTTEPSSAVAIHRGDLQPNADFDWFSADLNARQQAAVRRIVAGDAYPHPYVLFGPPGTGKTKTLVEAILQLWRRAPNSRILVCAATNAAADELALRLSQFVSNECHFGHNLYRLYTTSCLSRDMTQHMPQLEGCSNYPDFQTPSWDYLKRFRIVVCTLVVAGSFRYACDVQATDFSHVIVDESGSCTELAALLPMAVCTDRAGLHARVVLAGDPKQLGPFPNSRPAVQLGAGVSLLERLMQLPAYSKPSINNVHGSRFITQLINNYRSHPTIISLANQAFYDSELRASGARSRTHRFAKWWRLPVPGTPIIFHSVAGLAERPLDSNSLYNRDEIQLLLEYVEHLMAGDGVSSPLTHPKVQQSDIGVISPYALQCTKIRKALRAAGYPDIMVAPVESFQGRERPIILTSTVRSTYGMPGLGFLGCAKRLNVMISRAQSLLIMIGDAYTLRKDPSWRIVLRRFQQMGVCVGERFHVPRLGDAPAQRVPAVGVVSELASGVKKFVFPLPEDLQPNSGAKSVAELREAELVRELSIRDPRAHRVPTEPQPLLSAEEKDALLAVVAGVGAKQLTQKKECRRVADEERLHRSVKYLLGSTIEEVAAWQSARKDAAKMGSHSPVTSSGTSSPTSSLASLSDSLRSPVLTTWQRFSATPYWHDSVWCHSPQSVCSADSAEYYSGRQ